MNQPTEWEEENILSWLDAHRALPWKDRSDAYYEQYQVCRSVESLRGKKYHILRKQSGTGAKLPKHAENRSQLGAARRSVGGKASLETLPKEGPGQSNTAIWFHTTLTADPIHTESIESTGENCLRPGGARRLLSHSRQKERQSLSQIWDYVHLVCVARKPRYR
ncbi:unnamed protein product [Penicillium salamii]|nr:unnamed protein product [Penicillium salamii]